MEKFFFGDFERTEEIFESNEEQADKVTIETYSHLFKDDGIENNEMQKEFEDSKEDASILFASLFSDDLNAECSVDNIGDVGGEKSDLSGTYEPNSIIEKDGNVYATDDNGKIFKVNEIRLLPNTEYELDGNKYKTDDNGRIVSVLAKPKSTPEGERDMKAQEQVGGEDRKENDQGGHILARILGGAKGIENMVAMWEKVNTGPYKKMENEIVNAVKEGKDVKMEVRIEYDGASERPSKIAVKYTIDGKETSILFDNNEGSTDLLSNLKEVADDGAYQDIQDEIDDAEADGKEVSVLSVEEKRDENGNLVDVVVCIRYDGENHYRNVSPKQEG